MRAEGRWGGEKLANYSRPNRSEKQRQDHRPKKGSPCPGPRGLCGDFRAPGAGQALTGAPRRAGVSGQGPEAPPTPSLWARGVTGPRQLQLSHKAAAGEQVTPRVRRGLARGTSADQPQGGPAWLSHAVPGHLWTESAGRQAPRSGPGWKGLGCGRRHRDRGPQDTWHKAGSHRTLSVGSCRGHTAASSGLGPRGEAGTTLHSGPGLQRGG